MTARGRYIFCDIDGTLLLAPRAGRLAFVGAFADVFGVEIDISHINFSGATDIRVLEQLLREESIALDAALQRRFFDLLPIHLDRYLINSPPTVFPGVASFLDRVAPHWGLGLVTGNIRACAQAKLRHAGLTHYFNGVGGYGDDDGDRVRMAAIALERAGFPERTFLLGDTPLDIAAARANGMVSVAVCNGQFDRAALEAEGAELVLDSFEDAGALFKALDL